MHETLTRTEAPTRVDWCLLAAGAVAPLAVAVALYLFDVPLGKPGALNFPYTPFLLLRLTAVPVAVAAGGAIGLGVWLMAWPRAIGRRGGSVLVAAGCIALGAWSFLAPPEYLAQHFFNLRSPSADGAFLLEAENVTDVGQYLRQFPDRALTPPGEMRGTRVISNPPGATLLAVALRRALHKSATLERWTDRVVTEQDLSPTQRNMVAEALAFACALHGLWLISAGALYAAGRLFLSAPAAAVFAVCCLVSPMTLVFAPGKDPAQLLTVALPLALWLWSFRDGRSWAAGAAGALFVLACLVSLVHVWLALVLLIACGLAVRGCGGGLRRYWLRNVLPALGGAALAAVGLFLVCRCNVPAIAWSVTQSQTLAARGPKAMPFHWQTLGIPLFLLFAGPGVWAAVFWACRRRTSDEYGRLGWHLLVTCAVLMAATVGFTNMETPRLWIPFVPLLLLGATVMVPFLRSPAGRGAALLAVLAFVQVAASALHWSLMDMREAEMRISSPAPRFFE